MAKKKIKRCLIRQCSKKTKKSAGNFCVCPRCRAKRYGQVILHHSKKNWHILSFFLTAVFIFAIVMGPLGKLGSRAESQSFSPTNCFGAEGAKKAQGISDGELVLLNSSSLSLACGTFEKNEVVTDNSEETSLTRQDQRRVKSARLNFVLNNEAVTSETQTDVPPENQATLDQAKPDSKLGIQYNQILDFLRIRQPFYFLLSNL